MRNLWGDVRYAIRALLRQPTITAVALLTLVLGIGANSALFSVIKGVLLNGLPYHEPERLVVAWERDPQGERQPVSPPTYLDWSEQLTTFEALAAFRDARYAFSGNGEPRDVPGLRVTPSLFQVLHADALVGRTFVAEEGVFGRDQVVLLSHGFWQSRFGGDPQVLGRAIQLDARPYTVVGVMPAGFQFTPGGRAEIWTALAFDPNDAHGRSRRARALQVVGRLAAGTSPDAAATQLETVAGAIAQEYPDTNAGWSADLVPAQEQLVAAVRPALLVLFGAVGFLLLIVCANVANLMLARLSARRRELAVRTALGAGRARIVREILVESLLLAFTGGALGLVVAWGGVQLVRALPPGILPRVSEIDLDAGVVAFTLLVSIAVALAFGLFPALVATRSPLRDSLQESAGSTGSPAARRALSALVVIEVALAMVLLVGAGLLTRSFTNLMRVDPGFTPTNLIAAQIYLPPARYAEPHERLSFFERAIERLGALPGVTSVAAVSSLPMHPVGIDFALPFTIEGQAPPPTSEEPRADIRIATPAYFQTMGMRLLEGRPIDARDRPEGAGVTVINETLARRFFPDRSPLGTFIVNPHGRNEVVGIVADTHHYGLDSEPRPEVFLALAQNPIGGMALVVRTAQEPEATIRLLVREVWAIDPDQPLNDVTLLESAVARSVFLPRLNMLLLAGFATSALLLAAVGVYGVISYSVHLQTKELGLRMALGAAGRDAMHLVMAKSLRLVGSGILLGFLGTILVTRALSGLLFGVGRFDPLVLGGVGALLAAAALVASYFPARRATAVDPLVALRTD